MQATKNTKMNLKKITEIELTTTNEKETSFGRKLLQKLRSSSKNTGEIKMHSKELENYKNNIETRKASMIANSRPLIYFR